MSDIPSFPESYHPDKDAALFGTEREFISADIGDKRLNLRLQKIAAAFIKHPNANIPQATGTWAGAKATYRFFSNSKVTSEKIIQPHREATKERLNGKQIVLAVQDTSTANFNSHTATEGLGLAGNDKTMGLMIHPTLLISTHGTPMGVIDLQIWARESSEEEIAANKKKTKSEKENERRKKSIEEKESFKWISSLRAANKTQNELENITFVSVCDREGDFYDLFNESLSADKGNRTELLVRAAQNRKVKGEHQFLWETAESMPVQGYLALNVPRQKGREQREAKLAIRCGPVTINPPHKRAKSRYKPLQLWFVFAHEEECPNDADSISWMLLTTMPVDDFDNAVEKIEWYTRRWMIELFFKVLKSGCEIEERQLERAYRLKSCIAVDCVIAWMILFLTYVGREVPDLPASVIFEDYEWKAIYCFINKTPDAPDEAPSLQTVVRQIAGLGGFLGRKSDGEPGMITLWRGMWRMVDIAATYKIFRPV